MACYAGLMMNAIEKEDNRAHFFLLLHCMSILNLSNSLVRWPSKLDLSSI